MPSRHEKLRDPGGRCCRVEVVDPAREIRLRPRELRPSVRREYCQRKRHCIRIVRSARSLGVRMALVMMPGAVTVRVLRRRSVVVMVRRMTRQMNVRYQTVPRRLCLTVCGVRMRQTSRLGHQQRYSHQYRDNSVQHRFWGSVQNHDNCRRQFDSGQCDWICLQNVGQI